MYLLIGLFLYLIVSGICSGIYAAIVNEQKILDENGILFGLIWPISLSASISFFIVSSLKEKK